MVQLEHFARIHNAIDSCLPSYLFIFSKVSRKIIFYFSLAFISSSAYANEQCAEMIYNSDWPGFVRLCEHYTKSNSMIAYQFGFMYERGIYVSKSCKIAKYYYKLAKDKGLKFAQYRLIKVNHCDEH